MYYRANRRELQEESVSWFDEETSCGSSLQMILSLVERSRRFHHMVVFSLFLRKYNLLALGSFSYSSKRCSEDMLLWDTNRLYYVGRHQTVLSEIYLWCISMNK
ncbi:hypothetical protein BT93_L3017 [Corymbia citriodora subsp. variegata]|uniref:Uncharacterized protein n=1 Tax=Corymbia citriodora subsp. variegata TaxID=360336 RepID=A0A8T0CIK8_CORYI|nr:hypothetical protein BT93_L3017 [Corymbia citriodora subsp. variegata]